MKGRNVNRAQDMPAELYDKAVVQALLDHCGRGFHGKRNRALIGLLYHSGLRCAEVLSLQLHDIIRDAEHGGARIHVRSGKGRKQRVSALRPAGLALLDEFLSVRGDEPGQLLRSFDGKPLGTAAVRMLLPRIAKKAGVQQRVHAHGFRHTHAFELLNSGVPTPFIQRQLGHSRMTVTERYLNHVSPEAMFAAVVAS